MNSKPVHQGTVRICNKTHLPVTGKYRRKIDKLIETSTRILPVVEWMKLSRIYAKLTKSIQSFNLI